MDPRVNCITCLVADEEGMLRGAVAIVGGITHALVRTGRQTTHHLCAFDTSGTMKDGRYWASFVQEDDIAWAAWPLAVY